MVTIRESNASDATHLPAVEHSAGEAFRSIESLAWIANDDGLSTQQHLDLMERGISWVATDNSDKPVGFLVAELLDGYLHIWEMSVQKDHQGKGIGRMLLNKAKEYAKEAKYQGMSLTTFKDVPWNGKFYASAGFIVVPDDDLTPTFTRILSEEATHGLPREQRCAMRLQF